MDDTTKQANKIAIPRLRRPEQPPAPPKPARIRTGTVNKAVDHSRPLFYPTKTRQCTRCRKRKTKCSGTRPHCHNCVKNDDECIYEQPRRDRLRDALIKSEVLAALLKEIRLSSHGEIAKQIDETLQQFEDDTAPPTPSRSLQSTEKRRRPSSGDTDNEETWAVDEAHILASVDSNEDLDSQDEDLLGQDETNRTGFLDRNIQVQWTRMLQRKLNEHEVEPSNLPYPPLRDDEEAVDKRAQAFHKRVEHEERSASACPLGDFYFHLDHEVLAPLGNIDPDAMPPAEIAERLYGFYEKAVPTPFRILDDQHGKQLQKYYEMVKRGSLLSVSANWKAIMNIVFAIGARFSHLIGAERRADDHDHLVYMSRAVHFLELTKFTALVSPPDITTIQATGLVSFYYLVIGHVSRAWFMIGLAVRHAQAAGLHLRNEDTNMSPGKKQAISQTWRALYLIECVLTSITGRTRVVYRKDCTVPLLTGLKDGNSGKKNSTPATMKPKFKRTSSGLPELSSQAHAHPEWTDNVGDSHHFLHAWTDLDILQHKILSTLYSASTAAYPWQHVEGEIASFISELDTWARSALPREPSSMSKNIALKEEREQILLNLYHQSVRICATRPCLCRLDRRMSHQSGKSSRFNHETADACIQAALNVALYLPETSNAQRLYEKGPWWSTVHIIMQAITVLLLELTLGTSHLSNDTSEISSCVEELTRWLMTMKKFDGVAERAYLVVREMLSKNDHLKRRLASSLWLDEAMQFDQSAEDGFTNFGFEANLDPNLENFADNAPFPPTTFGTDDTLDLNAVSAPLQDPFDSFQFGQPHYPLYYGNEFNTLFDQQMGYVGDDTTLEDTTFEDWNSPQNRQPRQLQ